MTSYSRQRGNLFVHKQTICVENIDQGKLTYDQKFTAPQKYIPLPNPLHYSTVKGTELLL